MQGRTLRLRKDSTEKQVQSIAQDAQNMKKVDMFAALHAELTAMKARHRQELALVERQYKNLLADLKEVAAEAGETQLTGVRHVISFAPTTTRVIDPKALYGYLSAMQRGEEFWELVSVGLAKASSAYGDRALEAAGLIEVKTDKYGKVAATQRVVQ